MKKNMTQNVHDIHDIVAAAAAAVLAIATAKGVIRMHQEAKVEAEVVRFIEKVTRDTLTEINTEAEVEANIRINILREIITSIKVKKEVHHLHHHIHHLQLLKNRRNKNLFQKLSKKYTEVDGMMPQVFLAYLFICLFHSVFVEK